MNGIVKAEPPTRATMAIMPADSPDGKPLQALVKMTDGGMIQSVRYDVPVKSQDGHTYPQKGGELHLTGVWYNFANRFLGVKDVSPATMIDDDGQVVKNPHVVRDERRNVRFVHVYRVGMGRDVAGNLTCHTASYTLDTDLLFLQTLWSKWTKGSPKAWGVLETRPETKGAWRQFVYPSGLALWVDCNHADVIAAHGTHLELLRHAIPRALGCCWRNVLIRFLGVRKAPANLKVPVIAWPALDRELIAMGKQAAQAMAGRIVVDGPQEPILVSGKAGVVDVEHHTVTDVSPDEWQADDAGDEYSAPPEEPDTPAAVAPTPAKAPVMPDLRASIRTLAHKLGAKICDPIFAKFSTDLDTIGVTTNMEVLAAIEGTLVQAEEKLSANKNNSA